MLCQGPVYCFWSISHVWGLPCAFTGLTTFWQSKQKHTPWFPHNRPDYITEFAGARMEAHLRIFCRLITQFGSYLECRALDGYSVGLLRMCWGTGQRVIKMPPCPLSGHMALFQHRFFWKLTTASQWKQDVGSGSRQMISPSQAAVESPFLLLLLLHFIILGFFFHKDQSGLACRSQALRVCTQPKPQL